MTGSFNDYPYVYCRDCGRQMDVRGDTDASRTPDGVFCPGCLPREEEEEETYIAKLSIHGWRRRAGVA